VNLTELRSEPSNLHKQINFYPGNPHFDSFFNDQQDLLKELYEALTATGITPTHRVYMPWAVGFVDVTDPTVWDDTGKIRCFWVSPYSIADPAYSWKNPDAIIFDQILE
jgi:hypothetical protein